MTDVVTQAIADRLRAIHFDGRTCTPGTSSACSVCFGPWPMHADEVAQEVAEAARASLHPVIETTEQLDELPVGTIVRELDESPFLGIPTIPGVFHRFPKAVWGETDGWFVVSGRGGHDSSYIELPAIVLWRPEAGA